MINRKCAINGGPNWIPWTQPVLSSNGTLGGGSFACSASYTDSGYEPWKAFDNVASSYWRARTVGRYIVFYNPSPIKITQVILSFYDYNQRGYSYMSAGTLYGSDDGSNWAQITSFTGNTSLTKTLTISIPTAYKYYKLTVDDLGFKNTDVTLAQISITATYQA